MGALQHILFSRKWRKYTETRLLMFANVIGDLKNEDKVLDWLVDQKSKDTITFLLLNSNVTTLYRPFSKFINSFKKLALSYMRGVFCMCNVSKNRVLSKISFRSNTFLSKSVRWIWNISLKSVVSLLHQIRRNIRPIILINV